MRTKKAFVAAVHGVCLMSAVAAVAQGMFDKVQITFDVPPPRSPGSGVVLTEYYESGLLFTGIGSDTFIRRWSGRPGIPYNGTAYLQTALGQTLSFGPTDGSLFNLVSVDLAEYSTLFSEATTVPFVGYYPDGTTVLICFTTDGFIDGMELGRDFETFFFGPEFTGLQRVEIPAYVWSLDNLVITIPEPGAGALLVIGIALACFRRFEPTRRGP